MMLRSLSSSYDVVMHTVRDTVDPATRAQLRLAVVAYGKTAKDESPLQALIEQELHLCCVQVQHAGLDVQSDLVKLLVLSAFSSDAGFSTAELNSMTPNAIKRQLSSYDAIFARLIQKLFLHQTQVDIICQRLQSVLCGAAAQKCSIRARRLQESTCVTHSH